MDLSSFTTAELETVLSCAKNAVSISHPNLCKLLGVVIENGELITVSEQLPLTSILDILGYVIHQGKPISPAVSLRLVTNAIAATLAVRKVWCTQIGVTVERLVLSECLYVTDLGDVMLSEVGILPVIARCRGMMKNPSVVVQFAPEELKRAPFDESAVVYSFALLLWEFLANRRFFSSLTRSEARRSVLSQPVPTLLGCERLMAPEYGQLISIIERATCREPKLRIKTLADLHLELTSLPRTCIASDTEVAFVLRDLMQALRRPRPLSKTEVSKRPIVQARHVMR
jgi:serine/threonine protein kinase